MIPRSLARRAALALVCAMFAGCGSVSAVRYLAKDAPPSFEIDGRFSLRESGNAYQGRVSWRHGDAGERVLVRDPFGTGVAELVEEGGRARIELASGEVRVAANSAVLMRELTGVALPVARAAGWLSGRVPGGADARRDGSGRVTEYEDEGWRIRYEYAADEPRDGDLLPSRLHATSRDGIELRLVIETWTLP